MPAIRLLFLWHMHQPFYKDLVTGEYRLPWVRLHALKDYYGMVKLLDEFPGVHQTFNLVPSLVAQLQDYVAGTARDPFFEIAALPAESLDLAQRRFALTYLFQANVDHMIGRYSRFQELWTKYGLTPEAATRGASKITDSELTDLQVLSQVAWMDEFFLEGPAISELIKKGRDFTREEQEIAMREQREFLGQVLPAYAAAAQKGSIEISTSPYYHPILPLLCDTDIGAVSHSGLPLPSVRFRHPEDAREQIQRGLDLHEKVFGIRPRGMWPSEGSVSDDALSIAHATGIKWAATDEGVLGRTLGVSFHRSNSGLLDQAGAENLYQVFRWQKESASVDLIFRDHSLSDLIGFVYSGVPAREAAEDLVRRCRESAAPLLAQGKDAVVPVILDGENAWEFFPQSGREFLRRLYDTINKDPQFEPLTVSEAIEKTAAPRALDTVFPGSWINANFDVWIGAQEDNVAWDHLAAARDFYSGHAEKVTPEKRALAHEELLIAEGSDWNWWYGPEHHSANDHDFDELYRKHLSNVYFALGGAAPANLAQPISGRFTEPQFTPQTEYIHPQIDGMNVSYFEWLGAATHVADRYTSAMHGKSFLLDTGYVGIDDENLYCRLDFMEPPSEWATNDVQLLVMIETSAGEHPGDPGATFKLEVGINEARVETWGFGSNGHPKSNALEGVRVSLGSIFECKVPLEALKTVPGATVQVRFALWRDRLPVDSLPQQGSIDVHLVPEIELRSVPYAKP